MESGRCKREGESPEKRPPHKKGNKNILFRTTFGSPSLIKPGGRHLCHSGGQYGESEAEYGRRKREREKTKMSKDPAEAVAAMAKIQEG